MTTKAARGPKTVKVKTTFSSDFGGNAEGSLVVVSSAPSALYALDFFNWKTVSWPDSAGAVTAIAASPDGGRVAVAVTGGPELDEPHVELREARDGVVIARLSVHDPARGPATVTQLDWSPNGERLLAVSASTADKECAHLVLLDVQRSRSTHVSVGAYESAAAAFVDDATVLVLTSRPTDGAPDERGDDVHLLSLATLTLTRAHREGMDWPRTLSRSIDGRLLAVARDGGWRIFHGDGARGALSGEGHTACFDGSTVVSAFGRHVSRTTASGESEPPFTAARTVLGLIPGGGYVLALEEGQIEALR